MNVSKIYRWASLYRAITSSFFHIQFFVHSVIAFVSKSSLKNRRTIYSSNLTYHLKEKVFLLLCRTSLCVCKYILMNEKKHPKLVFWKKVNERLTNYRNTQQLLPFKNVIRPSFSRNSKRTNGTFELQHT